MDKYKGRVHMGNNNEGKEPGAVCNCCLVNGVT